MKLREFFITESLARTGEGKLAVVGWGRGMGHKGHMMLASSVITHASDLSGDPYFVVSRTYGPEDPIKPEEKVAIYKKVFPEQGHIFQTASDELPDLTRVLGNLNRQGYTDVVVIVGADQKAAFQYLNHYNGKADKKGNIAFNFDTLKVISRQETNDPSKEQEGPRATPMRQVLQDPSKSDDEQFAIWRDAMSDQLSDEEVRDLMMKAKSRMAQMAAEKEKSKAPKKKAKEPELNELSNELLGRYKKAASDDASSADKKGDFEKGNKRFSGIVKATKKQFSNDEKNRTANEEAAGVGIITKQNSTADVNKNTPKKNLRAFRLAEEIDRIEQELQEAKTKKIRKSQKGAMSNALTYPELNMSTGSAYRNYRFGIALAGSPDHPGEADNWIGGDAFLTTYTPEEMEKIKGAEKALGLTVRQNWSGKGSKEIEGNVINKTSPVAKVKKNKYGV